MLIERMLDDFKQEGYRKKGILIPLKDYSDITGKQNRIEAIRQGLPIGSCDFVWFHSDGYHFIRVKLSEYERYLRCERDFDEREIVVSAGRVIVWDLDSWRSWFSRKLKEIKKG